MRKELKRYVSHFYPLAAIALVLAGSAPDPEQSRMSSAVIRLMQGPLSDICQDTAVSVSMREITPEHHRFAEVISVFNQQFMVMPTTRSLAEGLRYTGFTDEAADIESNPNTAENARKYLALHELLHACAMGVHPVPNEYLEHLSEVLRTKGIPVVFVGGNFEARGFNIDAVDLFGGRNNITIDLEELITEFRARTLAAQTMPETSFMGMPALLNRHERYLEWIDSDKSLSAQLIQLKKTGNLVGAHRLLVEYTKKRYEFAKSPISEQQADVIVSGFIGSMLLDFLDRDNAFAEFYTP